MTVSPLIGASRGIRLSKKSLTEFNSSEVLDEVPVNIGVESVCDQLPVDLFFVIPQDGGEIIARTPKL
jgi:hypothetical protein